MGSDSRTVTVNVKLGIFLNLDIKPSINIKIALFEWQFCWTVSWKWREVEDPHKSILMNQNQTKCCMRKLVWSKLKSRRMQWNLLSKYTVIAVLLAA